MQRGATDMTVWQPGMRCVCIHGPFFPGDDDDIEPIVGGVYTVRSVELCSGFVVLRLREIVNSERSYVDGNGERGFLGNRFRPLSETRLDQFRAHLAPTPRERVSA